MKTSAVVGRSGWFLKIFGCFTANVEIRLPSGIIAELRSLKNIHQSGFFRPTFITSLKRNEDHATHSTSYRAGTDLSPADQHTTPQFCR
jgi:hypothetical protein